MATAIRFDEASHRYYDSEGREVLSVSRILRECGLVKEFSVPNAERYLLRGQYVHEAIKMDSHGVLDDSSLDPEEIAPRIEAWRKFRRDTGFAPVPESCETIVYDLSLRVAGTIDCIGGFPNNPRPYVCDMKNGSHSDWHQLQLAGYAICVKNEIPSWSIGRFNVYLGGDGKYKTTFYDDDRDLEIFKSAAVVANHKIFGGGK